MSQLLKNAKALRTNQTEAESRLWYQLRAHRFMNLKFKRQKPMGHYIVDFVCLEHQLIIELDGGQHADQVEYDKARDDYFNIEGFTVLRFWNNEVMQEMEAVLGKIQDVVLNRIDGARPHPSPLQPAGEGT